MESRALEIIFGQVGHDFTLQVDEILFNGGRDHRTVICPNEDLEYDPAEAEGGIEDCPHDERSNGEVGITGGNISNGDEAFAEGTEKGAGHDEQDMLILEH